MSDTTITLSPEAAEALALVLDSALGTLGVLGFDEAFGGPEAKADANHGHTMRLFHVLRPPTP